MFKIPWRLSAFVFVLAEHIILRYHFPCDCKAFYDEGDLTQRHLLQCFFPFPCLVLVRTLFGSPLSEITQMEKKNYNFLIFFLLVSISVVKHFIRSGFTVCICQKWDQYYLKSTIFFLFILTLFLCSQDWPSINQIQQEYFRNLEWAFCFLTFPILPPKVFRRQQDYLGVKCRLSSRCCYICTRASLVTTSDLHLYQKL